MLGILRDIRNRIIIIKSIKKWKNSLEWEKFNLIHDWFYNLAFILNLNKEYFGEDESTKQMRLVESANPVYEFISKQMKLGDLYEVPKIQYIEGTYSYLIKFKQIYNKFSFFYIFKILFIFILLSYLIINFNEICKLFLNLLKRI
jgi:hypothetical protein